MSDSFFDFNSSDVGDSVDVTYSGDLPTLQGDGNSFPVQSDTTPQSNNSVLQILGSIGTTAKSLGTAVGKAQHDIASARTDFQTARVAQVNGNSLSTWWQMASTTDKLTVGIGAAGLMLAVYLVVKKG